jgi:hypothetical protein
MNEIIKWWRSCVLLHLSFTSATSPHTTLIYIIACMGAKKILFHLRFTNIDIFMYLIHCEYIVMHY